MRESNTAVATQRLHALTIISNTLYSELKALAGELNAFSDSPAGHPMSPGLGVMFRAASFCGFWGVANYFGALRELAHGIESVPPQSVDRTEYVERIKTLASGINALGHYLRDLAAGSAVSYSTLNEHFGRVIRKARPRLLEMAPADVEPLLFMPAPPSLEVDAYWVAAPGAGRAQLLAALTNLANEEVPSAQALKNVAAVNPYRSLSGMLESAACLHALVARPEVANDLAGEIRRLIEVLQKGEPVNPPTPDAFLFSRLMFALATSKSRDADVRELRKRYSLTRPGASVTSMHDVARKFVEGIKRFQDAFQQATLSRTPSTVAKMAAGVANEGHRLESPAFTTLATMLAQETAEWSRVDPSQDDWTRAAALVLLMREAAETWGHQDVQDGLAGLADIMAPTGGIYTCESMQATVRNGAVQKAIVAMQEDFAEVNKAIEASLRSVGQGLIEEPQTNRVAEVVGGRVRQHVEFVAGVTRCMKLTQAAAFADGLVVRAIEPETWSSHETRLTLFDALSRLNLFIARLRPGSLLDMQLDEQVELAVEDDGVDAEFPVVEASSQAGVAEMTVDVADVNGSDIEVTQVATAGHVAQVAEVAGAVLAEPSMAPAAQSQDPSEVGAPAQVDEGHIAVPTVDAVDNFFDEVEAPTRASTDIGEEVSFSFDDPAFQQLLPTPVTEVSVEELQREFTTAGDGREAELDLSDDTLLTVMFEESWDCLDAIDRALATARASGPDLEVVVPEARRHIHTLKGVCRTVGLMATGAILHAMEDRLDVMPEDGAFFSTVVEPFASAMELVRSQLESARTQFFNTTEGIAAAEPAAQPGPETAPVAVDAGEVQASEAAVETAALDDAETTSSEHEAVEDAPQPAASETTPVAAAPTTPATVRAAPARVPGTAAPMVRIPVLLAGRMGDKSGAVLTASRRALEDMTKLTRSMRELDENLRRMAPTIRELEMMASASIASSQAQGGPQGFDPLELDRYTAMQELVRRLVENYEDTVGSAATLNDNLRVANATERDRAELSDELQRGASELLLVPVSTQAVRLERVVEKACTDTGRQAELVIETGSRVPAAAMDRLMPVFEHILRNAIAHGIEDQDVRAAAGKTATGRIVIGEPLQHVAEGGVVRVCVRDDGVGIDLARVFSIAVKRGLVPADAKLSDDAVRELLFMPGFSTAGSVSELAGRGVGLDVVRSAMSSLGGVVSVVSERGKGTEFTLTLPTDAASMSVVPVSAGGFKCLLPLTLVRRIVPVSAGADVAVDTTSGKATIAGTEYELIDMSRRVTTAPGATRAGRGHLVLMRESNVVKAVLVDTVGRQTRVVVKPLGPFVRDIPGMVAGTTMATGGSGLVVNPLQLPEIGAERAARPAAAAVTQVMVVDDSSTVRLVTSRFLKRCGYGVETARDGLEALQLLAKGSKPDVFLFDLEMPGMGGFELIAEVRRKDEFKDTPIVVITSRTAEKHRVRATQLGATAYLAKPYEDAQLLEVLTGLVGAPV